jgi:hypothetical protein
MPEQRRGWGVTREDSQPGLSGAKSPGCPIMSVVPQDAPVFPDPDQVARWISPYRFGPYLAAANHDHEAALRLYEWNAAASAAFLEVFHYLEVLLRNAMDEVLAPLEVVPTARLRPHDGWWFLSRTFLSDRGQAVAATSRDQLPVGEQGKRDKVLANLTLGFWEGLFTSTYENLFRHHLRECFPSRPESGFERKDVSTRLEALRKLRNRVAHHEPVWNQPLEELHEQALDIVGWLDTDAGRWVRQRSRVPAVLADRPVPAAPLAVIVPAARAWPLYQRTGAYVCQPGRFFQQISHLAFYTDGEIKPEVAQVLERRDGVPWAATEIARLKSTRDPRDDALAAIIRAARAAGWDEFDTYQVFFLSRPGEPGHVTLSAPLPNTRSGRGSAYVQRQRYARVDDLRRAVTTADLPIGR